MSRPLHRIAPALPVGAMKTFSVSAPLSTHTRRATCAEVDCGAWRNGWKTVIDLGTPLGGQQANYIRLHSGRSFVATERAGLVEFVFAAGQVCFAEHRVPLDRPEVYVVRDGDWRGNPTGMRRTHANAVDWVDEFANHQDKLADRLGRG